MSNNYLCEQRVPQPLKLRSDAVIVAIILCSAASWGYLTINLPVCLQHAIRKLLYNHLFFMEISQHLPFPIYRPV